MAGRVPKLIQPLPGNPKKDEEGKTGSRPKQLPVPDSKKIDVVRMHRHVLVNSVKLMKGKVVSNFTIAGRNEPSSDVGSSFRATVPSGLEPVFLNEMDEDLEWVFEKRILHLTLIEDPMGSFAATNLVGQDENGGAVRVSVYNIPKNDEFGKLLAFGSKLGIINPYHRLAADGKDVIRVDNPSEVVYLGKVENMCRYCGAENAQMKCSKCKVNYCCRECQVSDWKAMNHKIICTK